MLNHCEYNSKDLRNRRQYECHIFKTPEYSHEDVVYVSLFFAEFGRSLSKPWCVKYHNTVDHEYKYKTLKEARKAFNNIINSYPDIKVN